MTLAVLIPIIISVLAGLPQILDGFKALATDFAGLFKGLGDAKASAVAQQAIDITNAVETDTATATKWFEAEYPTIEALLGAFPGLPKLMYSATNIKADNQVTLHQALTAAQAGANTLKMLQGTAVPTP